MFASQRFEEGSSVHRSEDNIFATPSELRMCVCKMQRCMAEKETTNESKAKTFTKNNMKKYRNSSKNSSLQFRK